jgi:hypothetical protein
MAEGFALRKELADEKQKELRIAKMEGLEMRVFEAAAGIMEATFAYSEVRPDQTEPPPDWIERYGAEGAQQRLEVAKGGWLPQSVAPVAVKYAMQFLTGSIRGRSYRNQKLIQNNLNVKIALPAPTSREHPGPTTYEVRDLEE